MDPDATKAIADGAVELMALRSDVTLLDWTRLIITGLIGMVLAWKGAQPIAKGVESYLAGKIATRDQVLAQNKQELDLLKSHVEDTREAMRTIAGWESMTEDVKALEKRMDRAEDKLSELRGG